MIVTNLMIQKISSNPSLPTWEQDTQVLRVCGLLDEMVHLSRHTQRNTILNSFQLLLQPDEDPFCHLVQVRVHPAFGGVRCLRDIFCITSVVSMIRTSLQVDGLEGTQGPLVEGVVEQNLWVVSRNMDGVGSQSSHQTFSSPENCSGHP